MAPEGWHSVDCLILDAQLPGMSGLELQRHLAANGPGPRLMGDPTRLRQIVTNLLSNAIKFTERGEVVVRVRLLERADAKVMIRFEVQDTGIGIAPAGCFGRLPKPTARPRAVLEAQALVFRFASNWLRSWPARSGWTASSARGRPTGSPYPLWSHPDRGDRICLSRRAVAGSLPWRWTRPTSPTPT